MPPAEYTVQLLTDALRAAVDRVPVPYAHAQRPFEREPPLDLEEAPQPAAELPAPAAARPRGVREARWGSRSTSGRSMQARGKVTVAETLVDLNGELSFGPRRRRTRHAPCRSLAVYAASWSSTATHVELRADALLFTGLQGQPLRRAGFRRS